MMRILFGGCIGAVVGVAILAAWGASDGFTDGLPSARLPPGTRAAVTAAFSYAVFLGPWGIGVGGVFGMIAGFASWLVRPRRVGMAHVRRSRRAARPPAE